MKDELLLSDAKVEVFGDNDLKFKKILKLDDVKSLKDIAALWPYIKKYKMDFFLSGVFFFSAIGLSVSIPRIIGQTVDKLFSDPNYLSRGLLIFSVFSIGKILFDCLYKYLLLRLGERTLYDLREDLFDLLSRMPMRFFDINSSGRIISRSVNDVTSLSMICTSHIYRTIGECVTIIGSLFALLYYHPIIGVKASFFAMILIVFLHRSSIHVGRKIRKNRGIYSKINSFIADTMNGTELIFSQGLIPLWLRNYKRLNRLYYISGRKMILLWARFPSFHAVVLGIVYASFVYLIKDDLFSGEVSRGDFLTIIFYLSMVFIPFHEIAGKINEFQTSMSSMNRIREILKLKKNLESETENDSSDALLPDFKNRSIIFKNLSFSYDKKLNVLENLNLEIPAGEVTAIIGRTGSGKTTIANLICKLYLEYSGNLSVGEHNLRDFSRAALGKKIGIVTQQLFLFQATLRENLRLYDQTIDDKHIMQVIREIGLANCVNSLEEGLDTEIAKEGKQFSTGEKQLIVIARMLLRNPEILIFDEATANLDNNSEYIVQKALKYLFTGRTTVIIAHRLSTIQLADYIVVLSAGQIIEEGKPEELIAKQGAYHKYISFLE